MSTFNVACYLPVGAVDPFMIVLPCSFADDSANDSCNATCEFHVSQTRTDESSLR